MTSPTSQYLFAYGTLQSPYPEHTRFCGSALSVQPARIVARLFVLQEGYPILELPPESIKATATADCRLDWISVVKAPFSMTTPKAPFRWIEGELVEFPLTENALEAPDEWEGFRPGKPSIYQRVIAPVALTGGATVLAWVYICQQPPETAKAIAGARWDPEQPPS